MANPSNFQITPCVENNENFRLYRLRRKGTQLTQAVIKWPVYDGPSTKAKVVARAQGLRIYADNRKWHSTFSLVFEDERFKGSTLQVVGISGEEGEWNIFGGTGQFARATGVISKKKHDENWAIIDFAIHTFCPLPEGSRVRSLLTKIGPFGGNGGTFQHITEAPPSRLESITVCTSEGEVVNSIVFSYIDHDGRKRTSCRLGGSGGEPHKIKLDRSEFVKEVTGRFGTYQGRTVITSLKFVTDVNNTYGPFGDRSGEGTRFSVPVQDSSVVGFFGRGGKHFLHAVGVYVRPL